MELRLLLAASTLLLIACQPEPQPAPRSAVAPDHPASLATSSTRSAPDAQALAAAACRDKAQSFRAWLEQVDASGWPIASGLLDDGSHLVARSGPALDEPAPIIHLTASEQALDGVRATDVAALGAAVEQLLDLRRRTMDPSPFIANPRVYLAVDADVPWQRLVSVLTRIARSGIARVTFVFADPARAAPKPPASSIDGDIAKLPGASAAKRQQIFVEMLAYVYQSCPEALRLIAQFGNEVAELKQALVQKLPSALQSCRCNADDASARALHWALYGNPRPGSGFTALLAGAAPPSRWVRLAGDLPWRDAHAQVVSIGEAATGEKVGFAVEAAAEQKAAQPVPQKHPGQRQAHRRVR